MPCHLFTLGWAAILLKWPRSANYWGTMMTTFHWGPAGAAAFPDWSDHAMKIEGYIFVLHHTILVLMPLYFALRFRPVPASVRYFIHSTAFATMVNVTPYTLICYVTGLNLNYHLYPPPLPMDFIQHEHYRPVVIVILIFLSVFFRGLLGLWSFIIRMDYSNTAEAGSRPASVKKAE
eukprot:Hpha_TRINITY_DN1729_c0_g1::TRINITY_DN1729_c0_g1_i1::g.158384::m.158384